MKPHEKLTAFWRQTREGTPNAPLAEAEIKALESRCQLTLPTDFRDYLLNCSRPDGTDNLGFCWWGADRLDQVPTQDAPPRIVFCDFFVSCFEWSVDCGESQGRGEIWRDFDPERAEARSFADFVDLYLGNSEKLRGG